MLIEKNVLDVRCKSYNTTYLLYKIIKCNLYNKICVHNYKKNEYILILNKGDVFTMVL